MATIQVDAVATKRKPGLRCGGCGQRFPHLFFGRMAEHVLALDADGFETTELAPGFTVKRRYGEQAVAALHVMGVAAWGWRFDGSTWRPTKEHRARWEQAIATLRDPERWTPAQVRDARDRIARGSFMRDGDFEKILTEDQITPEVARRFALPTTIECPKCGENNRVTQKVVDDCGTAAAAALERLTPRPAMD
jgi:hypothetical protein